MKSYILQRKYLYIIRGVFGPESISKSVIHWLLQRFWGRVMNVGVLSRVTLSIWGSHIIYDWLYLEQTAWQTKVFFISYLDIFVFLWKST